MATIVILHHALQRYFDPPNYMFYQFFARWRELGHRIIEHYGSDKPPPRGDIGFLHIDLTVTPDEYRTLVPYYQRVINGSVFDIAKRTYSQAIVEKGTSWTGPVIVKTDANHYGLPETTLRDCAVGLGLPADIPDCPSPVEYSIFGSPAQVPDWIWNDDRRIVEKFQPETDSSGGYYIRVWSFFGDKERSLRRRSTLPIVKRMTSENLGPVEVPEEIRAWRVKLGFDYGKFDYVIHNGRPILLDANKTPVGGSAALENPASPGKLAPLADGIDLYLSGLLLA